MSTRPWRRAKLFLATIAVAAVAFFCVFNTSTRYGRWLYWQEPAWDDIDRFAYRTVKNNPAATNPFTPAATTDSITQVLADFRINDETLEQFAASHESTELVIIHDDNIALEYFQGHRRESQQSAFSCTKSVVSLLVGIALEEGLIKSVDDSIANYVDGLDPGFNDVTVRHLLTMTSGISDADEKLFDMVPAPWSDEVKAYYDPNYRRLATTFTLDHPPGERFEYHDFSPILVGIMLENVTGTSLSEYLSEKIWQPAGMQFPARWSLDSRRHGFEKTEAGLRARAIDLARLGALLVDPQQTIVSPDWLQPSVLDPRAGQLLQDNYAPFVKRSLDRGANDLAQHLRSMRYGYFWWGLEREGRYDFYANGLFGQFIYISPAARLVIVRDGTGHGGLNDWHFGNIFFKLASQVIAAEKQHDAE